MSGPSTAGDGAAAFVDLHAHSTASDGSRAPADVIREAKRVGLQAIALTDHDTLDGIAEAVATGLEIGVRVVPGVELSAVEGDVETHILGLHLTDTREMESALISLREMRRSRATRIVQRLNDLGVRIEFAAVLEQAAGGAIGRPHVARAMVAEGWAIDLRDAFDRYLGNGRPAYVSKDRLAVVDAIGLIHRAGGLAILAHPSQAAQRANGSPRSPSREWMASKFATRAIPPKTWLASARWSSIFRSSRAVARIGTAPPRVRASSA